MVEELMSNAVVVALVLAPLTTGLVEVVKSTLSFDPKYLPIVSLIVGILVALLIAVLFQQNLALYIIVGLVGGLSASGLYDQKKIRREQ